MADGSGPAKNRRRHVRFSGEFSIYLYAKARTMHRRFGMDSLVMPPDEADGGHRMKTRLQVPQHPDDRSDIEFLSKQPLVEAAIRMLVRAHNLAHENNRDAWQLAVSIADLRAFGVPSTELIIPLEKGYIEHAYEQTRLDAAKRSFRRHAGSLLTDRSCFVLTKAGAALAHRFLEPSASRTQAVNQMGTGSESARCLSPFGYKPMARPDSTHLTPPASEFTALGRISSNAVLGRYRIEALFASKLVAGNRRRFLS